VSVSFLTNIDLTNNQILNVLLQSLTSDPANLESKIYYNSSLKTIRYYDGTSWVSLGAAGAGGPPSGSAGGDLTGSTYPNPVIKADAIVDSKVSSAAAIQQSKILNLTTGTNDLGAKLDKAGGTMTGYIITHADPSSDLQVANKRYVDLVSQGFSFKNAVRLVSTSNIPSLNTLLAVDGVSTAAGDRVLLTAQTTTSQNGIWVAAAGAWARSTDMDATGELVDGTLIPVAAGTTYADSQWMCTSVAATPWVPNSTASTWTRFASLTDLVAGAGLTKTGTTLDIVSSSGDLTVNTDSVTVNSAPKWTNARTITLTGDVTSPAVTYDGTGNASIATTVVGGGGLAKHFAGNVGSGTAPVITHSLNTRDVTVEVYLNSSPWNTVICDVERTSVNTVTLRFASAVTVDAYRCVVTGR
jgi:hypothetical protein